MNHTPGPWGYSSDISGGWSRCMIHVNSNYSIVGPMTVGDACLIAQAPALLEALEEILSWDTLAPAEAVKNAQAVIKAARGKK